MACTEVLTGSLRSFLTAEPQERIEIEQVLQLQDQAALIVCLTDMALSECQTQSAQSTSILHVTIPRLVRSKVFEFSVMLQRDSRGLFGGCFFPLPVVKTSFGGTRFYWGLFGFMASNSNIWLWCCWVTMLEKNEWKSQLTLFGYTSSGCFSLQMCSSSWSAGTFGYFVLKLYCTESIMRKH